MSLPSDKVKAETFPHYSPTIARELQSLNVQKNISHHLRTTSWLQLNAHT
jgi:hypothetical protein